VIPAIPATVEREIKALSPQSLNDRDGIPYSWESRPGLDVLVRPWEVKTDYLVHKAGAGQNLMGMGFRQERDPRSREALAQGGEERKRYDDVTDVPELGDQYSSWGCRVSRVRPD